MIPIKLIIVLCVMILVFGTSGILGIVEDAFWTVSCGGCREGADALWDSVGTLLTAGQSDVKFGVEGILTLQNITNQTITRGNIDDIIIGEGQFNVETSVMRSLHTLYIFKIIVGSLLTLIYIYIFYLIVKIPVKALSGFPPPFLLNFGLAILLIALLQLVFTGFTQLPFEGWIMLFAHPEIWSAEFLEILSPIPPEALNLTGN